MLLEMIKEKNSLQEKEAIFNFIEQNCIFQYGARTNLHELYHFFVFLMLEDTNCKNFEIGKIKFNKHLKTLLIDERDRCTRFYGSTKNGTVYWTSKPFVIIHNLMIKEDLRMNLLSIKKENLVEKYLSNRKPKSMEEIEIFIGKFLKRHYEICIGEKVRLTEIYIDFLQYLNQDNIVPEYIVGRKIFNSILKKYLEIGGDPKSLPAGISELYSFERVCVWRNRPYILIRNLKKKTFNQNFQKGVEEGNRKEIYLIF